RLRRLRTRPSRSIRPPGSLRPVLLAHTHLRSRTIADTMPGVFLSYRRDDSGGWAGRLRDHLALRYGEDRVWQDVDDLTVGSDYLPHILKNIAAADAVLIVIGPHWLERPPRGPT